MANISPIATHLFTFIFRIDIQGRLLVNPHTRKKKQKKKKKKTKKRKNKTKKK
jgi:hypothetical protein